MLNRLRSRFVFQHVDHREGAAILNVRGLTVQYDEQFALQDITFSLNIGERVAVVGPNGAGKSTLFQVVAGVIPASSGEVSVFGSGPHHHICIAYVPQRSQVDWSFPVTVSDVVMMGRVGKIGLFRWPRRRDWQLVREALNFVGMERFANRQIQALSGGQQQRVFIARALAQEADMVLMDEPLSGLDIQAQEDILLILDDLKARNVNVLIATHDLNLALERFDRVLLLNRRLVGFGKPADIITPARLLEAFGGNLHVIETGEGEMMMLENACHHPEE
jgi:ABC-type Mn2+/Zn2+ transport system ATPase subunit